jgi:uncharacterized protein YkwD
MAVLCAAFVAVGPAATVDRPVYAAVSAESGAFPDTVGHWAAETIAWAASRNIVNGFEDGTFRPDRPVTEAEFLAMLIRAYPDNQLPGQAGNGPWYEPYYAFATGQNWPVSEERANAPYARGQAARLIAAAAGKSASVDDAIRFLLDNGLAEGKTDATLEGFGKNDTVTRAEAAQFIRNVAGKLPKLSALPKTEPIFAVRGVTIGESERSLIGRLGEPVRKDASEYGFQWYVYNYNYSDYVQVGVQDGKVVALYTNAKNWLAGQNVYPGSTKKDVIRAYGNPLDGLRKGDTYWLLPDDGNQATYEIAGQYVTFYYDAFADNAVAGILIIDKAVEDGKTDMYGKQNDEVRLSYERQLFDLANVARALNGLKPYKWDDAVANVARQHSRDMAENGYFDHVSPAGKSLSDRLDVGGVDFAAAAENIAAGQPNAITAHHSWMNSATGHRENILGDLDFLGVGVYFGGEHRVYYTQNFYTPASR